MPFTILPNPHTQRWPSESVGIFNKLKAQLIRAGLELSSWDSIIYFVVKRPYDFILTLILRKVNKNTRILKNIFQRLIYFVHSIIRQYNTIQN